MQVGSNGTRALAQPRSRPAARPPANPVPAHRRVDLNGLWVVELYEKEGKPVMQYSRVEQKGDEVGMCILGPVKSCSHEITVENICSPPDGGGPCWDNTTYEGHFSDDSTLDMSAQFDTTGHPNWAHLKIYIQDPDHIRYDWSKVPLWRVAPHVEDIACDEQNSSRTTAEYAFLRAKVALNSNDAAHTACWMHAAAVQGDVRSQALYSSLLYRGEGVAQDYKAAFDWAQRSAQQHEFFGEFMMALMYQEGKAMPADAQKSKEWLARFREDYKAHAKAQASSGWGGMSPEQQAVAMRATLAVLSLFAGAGDQDAAVLAKRMANPGMSESAAEDLARRDPNFQAGQQRQEAGLDTILKMLMGGDEQLNEAVKLAH